MDKWIYGGMDRWIDGWIDGWLDQWTVKIVATASETKTLNSIV